MADTEARVRAKGHDVTLTDGRTVTVRFDFAALFEVEEQFGSVAQLARQLASGLHGKQYQAILKALAIVAKLSADELNDLLDPRELPHYGAAIDAALEEAIPPAPAVGESGKAEASPNGSPGQTSTTPAPSPSVEATTPSGE